MRMPELSFAISGVQPALFAASPTLNFSLAISDSQSLPIHAVALRCQIRIEPARRSYAPDEKRRLSDLFGEPSRWGQTMRTMLWTHASVVAPPFTSKTSVDLAVPCTYDFNLAATKYFYGLDDGELPLCFLFSGTIFYADEQGDLRVSQIPWDREANFRLPVATWREMMDVYYPNTAFLALGKDAFDALYDFKTRHSIPTWEAAIERLLAREPAQATP
jgi:hypothetical protein